MLFAVLLAFLVGYEFDSASIGAIVFCGAMLWKI